MKLILNGEFLLSGFYEVDFNEGRVFIRDNKNFLEIKYEEGDAAKLAEFQRLFYELSQHKPQGLQN